MLGYYLKMTFRHQRKNKFFTLINLFEMVIAITAALLLFNYVAFEFSYDTMHSKKERIYRVESQFYENGELTDDWATSAFGYGSAMQRELKGIENVVRVGVRTMEQIVSYRGKHSREEKIGYVEASFFDIFDFQLKEGAVANQLRRPNTVVITEQVAKNIFGNENPIGEILTFAKGTDFIDCEITGVLEDFPKNSHFHLDYLISYETLPNWIKDYWYVHEAYTYVLLQEGFSPQSIENQFVEMSEKYKTEAVLKNKKWAIELVPLSNIYLNSVKQYERESKGNRLSLIILIIGALIILSIAWINYINITTVRFMERAKDIGVRQIVGVRRNQLIVQFFTESFVLFLEAMVFSYALYLLVLPSFGDIFEKQVPNIIFSSKWIFLVLTVLLLCTLLGGLLPAFIMTRVKPAIMLKGSLSPQLSSGFMRRALVVFQYTAALVLVCGTLLIFKQVRFMQEQYLGVNIDKTVVLKYPVLRNELNKRVNLFADGLKQNAAISAVTISGAVPGMEVAFYISNKMLGKENADHKLYEMLTVDESFIPTFGLELLAGENFRKVEKEQEIQQIIVNEAALRNMGILRVNDAVGKQMLLEGDVKPSIVLGVVKNWHQRGMSSPHTPIVFLKNGHIEWIPPKYISIKVRGNGYTKLLKEVKNQWQSYFPEASFDYFFLDQFFEKQYKSDLKFGQLVFYFTILSLIVAILGLWALTRYLLSKKVKEIGIRKIHGAKVKQIVWIFSKEIFMLILVSFVIAIPLSILIMKKWLESFAFRTDISWSLFAIGGLVAFVIALLTVSWQSYRAASRNPVEALRYE